MNPKMKLIASLKIWLVIYPSITLFYILFGEQLAALPLFQRTFLLTICLVPWMMFAGVPLLDSVIRKISNRNKKLNKG